MMHSIESASPNSASSGSSNGSGPSGTNSSSAHLATMDSPIPPTASHGQNENINMSDNISNTPESEVVMVTATTQQAGLGVPMVGFDHPTLQPIPDLHFDMNSLVHPMSMEFEMPLLMLQGEVVAIVEASQLDPETFLAVQNEVVDEEPLDAGEDWVYSSPGPDSHGMSSAH
ncbi:hypothetical protein CFIMG_006211RA [Ceratocystis fimbriata CBS 114723]|uniref:Uncharacterized protein n=1 Tax=Ceratocystis fimbriata CBS 114723 TaxID=1035309 RepID=A0A2C5WA75_9PEZI|nr:hypothetical protein CFIMG_006211RA [Ceratocystis fimbriata CBS 114723]